MDNSGAVIVPLYVYPSAESWDPVYDMYYPPLRLCLSFALVNVADIRSASSYPLVQFTAIVNIHNGPGEGALPNAEYSTAIETLNSLTNVRTIGYVATTWCTRDVSSVLDDIAAYSFWGEYDSSLAMNGIFVDETPTHYSLEYVSYLEAISKAVYDSVGLMDSYIGKLSLCVLYGRTTRLLHRYFGFIISTTALKYSTVVRLCDRAGIMFQRR
jgi:hypothetical protein